MSICCKRVIWRYCYKGLDSKDVIYQLTIIKWIGYDGKRAFDIDFSYYT